MDAFRDFVFSKTHEMLDIDSLLATGKHTCMVSVNYANATELVQEKDYYRKDGKADMCTAIRGLRAFCKFLENGLDKRIQGD